MNAGHILDALEMIDDQYILEARDRNSLTSVKKSRSMRRALILAAVITALLSLCGFAAYKFGWFDPWLQEPSASPTETVQSAIESQIHKACASAKSESTRMKQPAWQLCIPAASLPQSGVGRTSILPATLWLYGQNMMWSTTIPKPFWTTAIRSSIFT